ncbi:hypothetical protein ABIE26_000907 [Pedobacter africanus]
MNGMNTCIMRYSVLAVVKLGLNQILNIMNKLELNNFGVEELNTAEMTKTEGGALLNGWLGALLQPITATVGTVANDTFQFANKTVGTILSLLRSL